MNIQLNVLFYEIKKFIKWIVILLFFAISYIYVINYKQEIGITQFLVLIGKINLSDFDFFGTLFNLFQFSLTIYFSYSFYNYEIENAMDNIILRQDSKKWIKSKIFVQLFAVSVFQTFYFFIIVFLSQININLLFSYFLEVLVIHLFISLYIVFSTNFFKDKFYSLLAILFICFIEILFDKIFIFNFILIIIMIICECCTFNFKKLL